MIRRRLIAFVILVMAGMSSPGWAAFSSHGSVALAASVTVSSGTAFIIRTTPLPANALFGKNVVIPVQVASAGSTINTTGLQVKIVYQLFDAGGHLIGPPVLVPIPMARDPVKTNTLDGNAVLPRADLQAVQNGGQVAYLFIVQQGASGTMRNGVGQAPAPGNIGAVPDLTAFSPFQTSITNSFCAPVSPAGARVSAPDLSVNDGQTAVALAPGVVPAPGTLCIRYEDPAAGWPSGPGGSKAAAIYTITLQATTLAAPAELVLSYPSDSSGKVLDLGADPGSLGIYWLDQTNAAFRSGDWRPLSSASLDSTLHTLTGMTGHFSTFALFAAGAVGVTDLRPAERIITPNGDGINDRAIFGSGIDQVRIFDVRGRRVRTIPGPSPVWDGTDDDGRIVESGVYLYQYTSQGERVSGVIGVAK